MFWCSQEATIRLWCHRLVFLNHPAMENGLWHHVTGSLCYEDRVDEVSATRPCTGPRANCKPVTSAQQQLWLREDDGLAWFPHSIFPTALLPGVSVFTSYQTDCWSRKTRLGILASCSFSSTWCSNSRDLTVGQVCRKRESSVKQDRTF